jgi:glycosyltransferase involved in cell wall biosynthesis
MKNYRTANKMSLTPQGTFVLTPPTIQRSRAPTVAFLSRLVSQKGIDDFLDILPDVWRALKDRIPKGFKFIIGGYGPLQGHVANRVDKLNAVGVPIDFIGYTNATELFACTSVVLSMQEITNYPSRVVAEALMSGCAVIVRNTGDSMHFGNNIPGLFYCEGHLKSTELAEKIERLVGFIINDSKYSITIRASAIQKFGSEECINYFKRILSCRQFTHFRYRC